jgi:hypothetical protein
MKSAMQVMLLVGLVVFAGESHSANNWTDAYYEINEIVAFSTVEPVYPNWAGYSSVTFKQTVVWASPNACSSAGVAVRPNDKHIFASIQMSLALGKRIRLYVDDTNTVGGYCILRAIQFGSV